MNHWCALALATSCAAACSQTSATSQASSGHSDGVPVPQVSSRVGIVSHVKVLSDKVEDVSSVEAWKRSFLRPDMTDAQRAQAVWTSVVKFRHQDEPPNEYLGSDPHPHDPIRSFNVYGYDQCDCATAAIEALGRAAGLPARGHSLRSHSVAELFWDGGWHMLDAAFIDYFPTANGQLASVDDIIDAVGGWLAQRPDLQDNFDGLRSFQSRGNWKQGPALLATCPFYSATGFFPANIQGWANTMYAYDRKTSYVEDFPYTLGYQVNVQLRKGERLTRNWFNFGRHINDDEGGTVRALGSVTGQDELSYTPTYGDVAPGRIGNGTLEYELPFGDGELGLTALVMDHLVEVTRDQGGPGLRTDGGAQPGILVVRMPSSYVYLTGTVTGHAHVGAGGQMTVSISVNHGLDWTPVAVTQSSGAFTYDLTPYVRRHYDYLLRFELRGTGTSLDAAHVAHFIQHSQRPLPALTEGDNVIQFSAGPDEGTITIEGGSAWPGHNNLAYTDFHPEVIGLADGPLHVVDQAGQLTFPIATPGQLQRLRFGLHYRARGAGDEWAYQVSFDQGRTFTTVDRVTGPVSGDSHFITYDQIPAGARQAMVRFAGKQTTASMIFDIRIDADYVEPHGGFRPVKVTYSWDENGIAHQDVHVAMHSTESYVIHCNDKPHLRSLVVELAN